MLTFEDIVKRLCSVLGVEYEDLISKKRDYNLVMARIAIAYTLRYYFNLCSTHIGRLLHRDHSSIVRYCKIHEAEYTYNSNFRILSDKAAKEYKLIEYEQKYNSIKAEIEIKEKEIEELRQMLDK